MNEQEFRDAALIAIASALATVQQPYTNEYDRNRGATRMMSVDEVVGRASVIVDGLVKERRAATPEPSTKQPNCVACGKPCNNSCEQLG